MFTIGTDPELFVVSGDKVTHGIGRVGGSKSEPRPVNKGAVQEDNMLAEFNIIPASNADEFVGNIATVIKELAAILQPQGFGLLCKASHSFSPDDVAEGGQAAWEFGCDPDYNCWTREVNDSPEAEDLGLRTAGGHVHIGYDAPDNDRSYAIACACDYLLGLPSILIDTDDRRKELYGKAGACRIKPYGVEYRVLSNFWLATEELQQWVYAQAVRAGEFATDGSLVGMMGTVSPDEVQRIINTNDKAAARAAIAALSQWVQLPN